MGSVFSQRPGSIGDIEAQHTNPSTSAVTVSPLKQIRSTRSQPTVSSGKLRLMDRADRRDVSVSQTGYWYIEQLITNLFPSRSGQYQGLHETVKQPT